MAGILDFLGGGGGQIVGGLLGGLAGANSGPATTTSTAQMDPTVKAAVYKQLAGTGKLYDQQMAQGGLNDVQRAGLQQQLNVYSDPSYNAGFQQMRSLGSGLLGQPVAGNPFTNGAMADGSWRRGAPVQSSAPALGQPTQSYMPSNYNPQAAFDQSTYKAQAASTPASAPAVQGGGLLGGTPNAGNGGQQTDFNPNWTAMGDVEKANYYADNPMMAYLTQLGQLGYSLSDLASIQREIDPGFVRRQMEIARGDAFSQGPGFRDVNLGNVFAGMGPGDISALGVNPGRFGEATNDGLTGLASYNNGSIFGNSANHSVSGGW